MNPCVGCCHRHKRFKSAQLSIFCGCERLKLQGKAAFSAQRLPETILDIPLLQLAEMGLEADICRSQRGPFS